MRFLSLHRWLIGLLCCTVAPIILASTIYRNIDDQGRVTYSDTPTSGAEQLSIGTRASRQLLTVDKVYDGDTIIVKGKQSIRLLGVNTPEIASRHRTAEPGGAAAKKWLQEQLRGKAVYLEFDQEKLDKYKRQLAHVFLPNGEHINLAILQHGLGTVSIIPPNVRYSDKLIQAQQHAEQQQLGIWAAPEYQPRPIAQIAIHAQGWQRFVGTPVSLKKNKKYTRLIFNGTIDVRIANSNLKSFPEISTYVGKTIEIRGWVTRKKDHYTMLIQHPSALIVKR